MGSLYMPKVPLWEVLGTGGTPWDAGSALRPFEKRPHFFIVATTRHSNQTEMKYQARRQAEAYLRRLQDASDSKQTVQRRQVNRRPCSSQAAQSRLYRAEVASEAISNLAQRSDAGCSCTAICSAKTVHEKK